MGRHCLKLDTPTNIRRSLERLANMVYKGEIDRERANSITVMCNAILGSIRVDEQEKKIAELERILNHYE